MYGGLEHTLPLLVASGLYCQFVESDRLTCLSVIYFMEGYTHYEIADKLTTNRTTITRTLGDFCRAVRTRVGPENRFII